MIVGGEENPMSRVSLPGRNLKTLLSQFINGGVTINQFTTWKKDRRRDPRFHERNGL